jgi:hypothetical protein
MGIVSQLDTNRHAELFKPEEWNTPVHVIGAGATGSWVVLQLAKLGITNITVWDDDIVEAHNVPNQAFGIDHVGLSKVDALGVIVLNQTGTSIKTKYEKVTNQRLSGVVFMMIDTMHGRKSIWENSICGKSAVKHLIEPRMGLEVGRVYNVNPTDLGHMKAYASTFYGDDVAEVSACGYSMTVITSAMLIASMCVKQLLNFHNNVEMDNEIIIEMTNNYFMNARW